MRTLGARVVVRHRMARDDRVHVIARRRAVLLEPLHAGTGEARDQIAITIGHRPIRQLRQDEHRCQAGHDGQGLRQGDDLADGVRRHG